MRKPVLFLGTALSAAVVIFFFKHFEVRWGDAFEVRPRAVNVSSSSPRPSALTAPPLTVPASQLEAGTLRVAGLLLDPPFDAIRMQRQADVARLSEIIVRGRFDLLSLQGVVIDGPKPFVPLLDELRQQGYEYEAISGPVETGHELHRFVVLYNRKTLEAGHRETYVVPDHGDVFRHPPLVTCFRAIGPPADQAFTFSVVSVHVEASRAETEIALLGPLFSSIQDDGRSEDDVLMVGNFQYGGTEIRRAAKSSRLVPLLREEGQSLMMTNTDRSQQLDNFIIDAWATTEFTGRFGVYDFMRESNLRLDEARKFSDRLPVWAEFQRREAEIQPIQ